MIRFNRVVCAALVCGLATFAYGKAVKVTYLVPASPESDNADGMAITNFNTGLTRTEVQVAITGFTSDQPYCISVRGSVGAEIILPVWTNQSGNAAAHGHILGEFHGDCILLTVYVDDLGGGLCDFIGPEDSVRAEGNSCW